MRLLASPIHGAAKNFGQALKQIAKPAATTCCRDGGVEGRLQGDADNSGPPTLIARDLDANRTA